MELGRELYEKYKGRTGCSLLGAEGPVVGWCGKYMLIDVGEKVDSWRAYEGKNALGGVVHLPECGGTIYVDVNRVLEKNII